MQNLLQKFPGSLRVDLSRVHRDRNSKKLKSVFRLRYQIYCDEAHFLNPLKYPLRLERDEYDSVSEHVIATNPDQGNAVIGSVRLVRWTEALSFPTARHFHSLENELRFLNFPLQTTAEVSRLCISKSYRKRAQDGIHGVAGYGDGTDARRKFPVILLELFRKLHSCSKQELGITHWIGAFEDVLYRLLSRYGIRFELITPEEIEYYGKVKIYGASIQYIEEALRVSRPDLYGYFVQ